jgi:hypothetical protein
MLAAMRVQQDWQRKQNKGKDAHMARATTPAQHQQQQQRNACNDASNMWAGMPAQCRKRHQRCINRTLKAKLPWSDAGDGNKAICDDEETATTPHTLPCCAGGRTGQTPVCNAGSKMGAARATTPSC